MFARKALVTSLVATALLSMSFSVQPTHAQSSTACPSGEYANPFNYVVSKVLPGASYSKPDSVGNVLMALISTRYQYEDAVPPAGCEAAKDAIIKFLTIQEDSILTTEAETVDAGNKDAYTDIGTNIAPPRYKAITTAVSAALSTTPVTDVATMPAVPMGTATAPAQTCADPAFVSMVKTDTDSMNGGPADIIVKAIKLRYKYEDATVPDGCNDGRNIIIQAFAITEDYGALTVMAQIDATNASIYGDFIKNTLGPRATISGAAAKTAFPSLAKTPAATAAATDAS